MARPDRLPLVLAFAFAGGVGALAACNRAPRDVAPTGRVAVTSGVGRDGAGAELRVTGTNVLARARSGAIAIDGARVLFGDDSSGTLLSVSKSGGVPVVLGAPAPRELAVRGSRVVWIPSRGDVLLERSEEGGRTVPLLGGELTALAAGGADAFVAERIGAVGVIHRVASSGDRARLADVPAPVTRLAIDATNVYAQTGGAVYRIDRRSGRAAMLASGTAFSGLALDEDAVYATDERGPSRALVRVPKSGGDGAELEHAVRDAPIAVFGGEVYFLDEDQPSLRRVSVRGGASSLVARREELARVADIAIDDSGIYAATHAAGGGAVLAMPLIALPASTARRQ